MMGREIPVTADDLAELARIKSAYFRPGAWDARTSDMGWMIGFIDRLLGLLREEAEARERDRDNSR